MTAISKTITANIPQQVRDQNARQLRADFLAETFKAFRAGFTRTVERAHIHTQA
jgi:hypothetical protein